MGTKEKIIAWCTRQSDVYKQIAVDCMTRYERDSDPTWLSAAEQWTLRARRQLDLASAVTEMDECDLLAIEIILGV